RMAFYDGIFGWNGSWSVPMPIYNGSDVITEWPGTYWSDLANELKKRVAEDHAQKAVMEIHITNASISDTKRLTLEFEVTSPIDVEANVIAVIAEHTTTGNRRTNGEKEFHHVALDFPTGAQGVTKNFEAGKKETFSYAVAMSRTNMEGLDLEVLCFVQHKSGYIFQSSSIIEGGNVANEEEMLGDIRVYPNPARENTTISGLESANVAVFDMTGRQVYMQNGVDGNLELSLSGFAEGTYVIRIVEGGKIAHRKLIVVR
ncbi:MAG: T9SS type A sorting domain-containing protein, partial [Bacteroidales bacterium]|nr:T9SS type A sorting domain-containing protein [Bacteroidales bacterium]